MSRLLRKVVGTIDIGLGLHGLPKSKIKVAAH
jgi:hypothetical protein